MPCNVLFLCTANSARSIMAESLLNTLGGGRFRAFSAGSHPGGRVNPLAIEALQRAGCEIRGLRSKGMDEFAAPGAPALDFVITVCDAAARESCPVFPGKAIKAHWGLPDPAAVGGDDAARREAFASTLATLRRRVQHFTGLPFDSTDARALANAVRAIGQESLSVRRG